jgi:class 3 adenylate cyclase
MSVDEIRQLLCQKDADADSLFRTFYDEHNNRFWNQCVELYVAFGKKFISTGHPTRAFELVREGSDYYKNDRRLQYLNALALARGRNINLAEQHAKQLLTADNLDDQLRLDAVSLIGRLHKGRYQRTTLPEEKADYASRAYDTYRTAYQLSKDSFPGINAASMSLLANIPKDKVHALAKEVLDLALAELKEPGSENDYWLFATIGEAYLLLEQFTGTDENDGNCAEWWYRRAITEAAGDIGSVVSMRRQVQLLKERLNLPEEIMSIFSIGACVIFSGHMIDHPDRQSQGLPPRFPADAALENEVATAIGKELEQWDANVGYVSAGCGSDILFAEQMIQRKAELHIVLPFDREDFYKTSVDFGLPEMSGWRERCDKVLAEATELHYATPEKFLGDDLYFDFVNRYTQGLALARSDQMGVKPIALVVKDPSAQSRVGGTTFFLEHWKKTKHESHEINLAKLRSRVLGTPEVQEAPDPNRPSRPSRAAGLEIKAMLFADVTNFSKLRDDQSPIFFVLFLDKVAELIDRAKVKPIFKNTWGDGLYLVFDEPEDCAEFALCLLKTVSNIHFEDFGLPKELTVRIGIHTGPVYRKADPIIGRDNFFGSHVNRTARIEPVTIPGCVYGSEQIAAVLAVGGGEKFVCEFVGVEKLAKEYDSCPLFQLSRR